MSKGRKGYSSRDYECLFDYENQITIADLLRHDDVLRYRTKTITSGPVVECEIYPIWKHRTEVKKAAECKTPLAQKAVNERNARKRLIRKINSNFTEADVVCHLTYADEAPDLDQARKDMQNYIRRVRDYRKRMGMSELKYVYVIEYDDGESGTKAKRIHQHVIMSGMDRDIAQQLWTKGRANCDRLQPDEYGFEALARYMLKDPKGKKRWSGSKNLAEPIETIADHKVTVRQVERIAMQMEESAGKIFASKFPACNILDITVKRSDRVAGAYIYAKMRKSTSSKAKKETGNGKQNQRLQQSNKAGSRVYPAGKARIGEISRQKARD